MSNYINDLVRIAQEMPGLQYDIDHAGSSTLNLMSSASKLCAHVTFILHHVIHDYYERNSIQPPSQHKHASPTSPAASTPIAQPRPPQHSAPPSLAVLPYLPPPAAPIAPAQAASTTTMADVPIQPGVTNVIITSQGTTVTTPGGIQSRLPPGVPIPLEVATDVPSVPPPAPDGHAQVILPRGGSMSPEVIAALHVANVDQPPPPTTDPSADPTT